MTSWGGNKLIKLIVSDLDGTLLTKKNEVMEHDIKALQKATRKQIDICIATGRMDNEILEVLKMVNGKFHRISQNGAFVYTKDHHQLHAVYFKHDIAHEIYHKVKDNHTITFVCNHDTNFVEEMNDEVRKIEERMFFPIVENPKIASTIGKEITPSKITVLAYDAKKRQQEIMELFHENVDTFISEQYCLDIMPKNISKGDALIKLCKHLNLSTNEIACIGDSYNDIPMFQLTKHSFAMSHAAEEVKMHATHLVESVSDAISFILEENYAKKG